MRRPIGWGGGYEAAESIYYKFFLNKKQSER